VLLVGLAVQLVPLVAFPTALTQDGPAHVDAAWVLLHHGDPGAVGAVLREHYRIDLSPVPNMLTTFLLVALLPVLGPDVGERVMVGALVVALVSALAYALRGVDRRAGWLAVAALPFAGSHLMAFGFYNFGWGVVGSLLILGLSLRRRTGWSVRSAVVLTLLLLVTWTAHLLPFLVAEGSLLVLALFRARADLHGGSAPARGVLGRHVGPVLAASLPAAALTLLYLRSGAGPPAAPADWPSFRRVLDLAVGIRPFVTGSAGEVVPAVLTTGALAALAVVTTRRAAAAPNAERSALGLLALAATVGCLLTPGRLGPAFGFLVDRFAWFPSLLLVLWCATGTAGRWTRHGVAAVLVVASCAAVAVRLPGESAASRNVTELLSVAPHIRPGSVLVVLDYVRSTPPGPLMRRDSVDFLRHESSRLAVRAGGVDVGHYEATTPYFQVTFDGGPQVRRRIDRRNGLERVPPRVDLPAVRSELDYVVLVGLARAPESARTAANTVGVLRELSAHYRRVATSSPTGLVEVWQADRAAGG
jgi:hypothetical protein